MSSDKWIAEKRVYWLDNGDAEKGAMIFSFDKKKRYNLFGDYPDKLTRNEQIVFAEDCPQWADFFGVTSIPMRKGNNGR